MVLGCTNVSHDAPSRFWPLATPSTSARPTAGPAVGKDLGLARLVYDYIFNLVFDAHA